MFFIILYSSHCHVTLDLEELKCWNVFNVKALKLSAIFDGGLDLGELVRRVEKVLGPVVKHEDSLADVVLPHVEHFEE